MKFEWSKEWWKKAGDRAVRTVAQTAAGAIGAAMMIHEVDWKYVVSAALLGGIMSILTSIGFGIPEMED